MTNTLTRVDVVIDLEAFGTSPGSAIAAIAARTLDEYPATFSAIIKSPTGSIDLDTVRWWLMQRPEVQRQVVAAQTIGSDEVAVLRHFRSWLTRVAGTGRDGTLTIGPTRWLRIWGDEGFDVELLEACYRRHDLELPWRYREVRALRTALELAQVEDGDVPWLEGEIEHVATDCVAHAARGLTIALALMRQGADA